MTKAVRFCFYFSVFRPSELFPILSSLNQYNKEPINDGLLSKKWDFYLPLIFDFLPLIKAFISERSATWRSSGAMAKARKKNQKCMISWYIRGCWSILSSAKHCLFLIIIIIYYSANSTRNQLTTRSILEQYRMSVLECCI